MLKNNQSFYHGNPIQCPILEGLLPSLSFVARANGIGVLALPS